MPVSSDEVVDDLREAGWAIRQGKGSHTVAISPDGKRRVTIPRRRELAAGTLGAIERQTGMRFRWQIRRA